MNRFDFGTLYEGTYKSNEFKKDTVFSYTVHVPDKNCKGPYAVCVNHDGLNDTEVKAMKRLSDEGKAPYCIFIGVMPGKLFATNGGKDLNMRLDDYDIYSDEYPNFIVNELIPYLKNEYSLDISDSPDMHEVSGGSSGGISAFNMAWIRNDYFHRVYMSSPSFLSMVRGNEFPALVRKFETKPIKVYMEYSEYEPNDYFGSSICAALEIKMALEFAGYEFKCEEFKKEGHCSRYKKDNDESLYKGLEYLWKNYDTEPIKVKKLSSRVSKIVSLSSKWEKASGFPKKQKCTTDKGTYTIRKNKVMFTPSNDENKKEICILDSFKSLSSIELSSDMWRLYVADRERGCIYAYMLDENGIPSSRYLHGSLHRNTDFVYPGGFDICTSEDDRLFVSTEIGIQAIRSYGLIDAIISLPDGLIPEKISFGKRGTYIYAKTKNGIYKRKLKVGGRKDHPTEPKYVSYYD